MGKKVNLNPWCVNVFVDEKIIITLLHIPHCKHIFFFFKYNTCKVFEEILNEIEPEVVSWYYLLIVFCLHFHEEACCPRTLHLGRTPCMGASSPLRSFHLLIPHLIGDKKSCPLLFNF